MTDITQQTLAGIVTNDHRAALVLEKYNLDFCCKGKRTLAAACTEKGLSSEGIVKELEEAAGPANSRQMPFNEMTAEQLISHILVNHHFYVKQIMPQIYTHLERVAVKHGDRFPEMKAVFGLFAEVMEEMTAHMQKEEMILFPGIKEAERAFVHKEKGNTTSCFINGAVDMMEAEHDQAGEILYAIRELTHHYGEPEGACTTFKLSLAELKAFEEDLHQHVHLENNILFPMAKGFVAAGQEQG
ncbi:MAG: iron-sulfur cluster repair di-iron protein [Bacteroidota bacterium]|nr:iron-sulfur cluster repair di-iron protein [Bacteroidota bacterium]